MQSRWFHRPVLHSATTDQPKRPTWLELFYDLVLVAAFLHLGNGLGRDTSAQGATEFTAGFLPLWAAWMGFTFHENRFTVDDFAHRLLVLLQIGAAGVIAVSTVLPSAGPWYFALSAGALHVLIALMYLRAHWQVAEARAYTRQRATVFGVAGATWLFAALGPTGTGPVALWLCAAMSAVVMLSPLSARTRAMTSRYPLDAAHLGERYGLFTLFALGGSFVTVLSRLGDAAHGQPLASHAGIALLLTAGIWWVYFDDVAGSKLRPGRAQWVIWLYAHLPLVMGIIASSAAIAQALQFDTTTAASAASRYLLAGAFALTYLSVAMIDAVSERKQAELSDRARVNARALSGLLLLLLGAAGGSMSGLAFVMVVVLIGVAQVAFDLMVAPLVESPTFEAGARTLAELAKERQSEAPSSPLPAAIADPATAIRKGTPSELRRDLYFYFIEGSWWRVAAVFSFAFVALNGVFAALYVLEPGSIEHARPHSFVDAFFFSVQTMSTIGYGTLSPASAWANGVVTLEAVTGMVCVAVMTGLVFAKLSRPRSGVLFSDSLVLTTMRGKRVLILRAGNTRGNEVMDASATLSVLMDEITPEGHHFRRVRDLPLVRARTPVFMLSWTIMHEIDDASPLADIDWSQPEQALAAFIATIVGHDGTYGQTTYARRTYAASDLIRDARFVDIVQTLPDGRLMVDYARFHDTEPDTSPN